MHFKEPGRVHNEENVSISTPAWILTTIRPNSMFYGQVKTARARIRADTKDTRYDNWFYLNRGSINGFSLLRPSNITLQCMWGRR